VIAEFLRGIWGPEPLGPLGEIRTIERVGTVDPYPVIQQKWVPIEGPDWWEFAADAVTSLLAEDRDIYFGVLARTRRGGTAADVVDQTRVLWSDIDAKKFSDVVTIGKAAALVALNAFPIPPQVIVDSGGGWHAYWRLSKSVPFEPARDVMTWIAREINGDAVYDVARILRVPGTFNWKRGEPVPARLVKFDLTRTYDFSHFTGIMPPERERRPMDPNKRVRVDHLPDWLEEAIAQGAPQGQRSEAAFRVMLWLVRYGRTPEEIREIFESYPVGIGEKMAEKSSYDADRWFDTTLRAAEAVA